MGIWLALATAFFFEEVVTTTGVLAIAYREQLSYALIHCLWAAVVVSETVIIYALGAWIRNRSIDTRIGRWIERRSEDLERLVGPCGKDVSLGMFAFFFSPGLAALLAAWARIPFLLSVSIIILADFFWYLFEWSIVLGAAKVSSRFEVTIGIALLAGLAVAILMHAVRRKLIK